MIRHAAIRAQHGARKRLWNRARVKRLCTMLGITREELIAYLDWEAAPFDRALKANRFPGPVCIVLELYEQYALKLLLGEEVKFDLPFPSQATYQSRL